MKKYYYPERFNIYKRMWYGASREPNAGSQYEFEWIDGLSRDMKELFWQIDEKKDRNGEWKRKCVYTFIQQRAVRDDGDEKPLLYMTNCDDFKFFDRVVCEKTVQKHPCEGDRDCHEMATCVRNHCVCGSGFAGDGYYCSDINECHEYGTRQAPIKVDSCKNNAGKTRNQRLFCLVLFCFLF